MTDEEFFIGEKEKEERKVVIPKRITFLKEGDEAWIVSSDGYLLHKGRVERVVNSYVEIDRILYWKRGVDGKHRNRNNYTQFAMSPEDAKKYVIFYPKES